MFADLHLLTHMLEPRLCFSQRLEVLPTRPYSASLRDFLRDSLLLSDSLQVIPVVMTLPLIGYPAQCSMELASKLSKLLLPPSKK